MISKPMALACVSVGLAGWSTSLGGQEVLPTPTPKFKGKIELRALDSIPDYPQDITAPKGAPNVLLILLDDVGFGASGTFGGPIPTPNFDKLAQHGLRYIAFHTTALSSPTRAALLTGRNHHSVHFGQITELATGFPGYDSLLGGDTATVAEILRQHGYSTGFFGKHHNVPDWRTSPVGPYEQWPTNLGFERFYGFLGGDTDQWSPAMFDGTQPIEPYEGNPKYILNTDLADHAIAYIQQEKSLTPQKPFFVYYAPGATHAPHQVPKDWIAKFKGQFDYGWDKQRELTIAKQKKMGIVPANAKLTTRPASLPAWDTFDDKHHELFAHMMEVYAGFLAQTDYEVGRVLDEVRDLGQEDNTLVILIIGDNGASAEGTVNGSGNEMAFFNQVPESFDQLYKHMDDLGGPGFYNHYPVGWAWAMDSPFQWTKQVASHFGGTRNAMITSWPARIKGDGSTRSQFHHVIDIVPTILDAAGIPEPYMVNGVTQKPIEGVSMTYTWDNPTAPSRRTTQYFEMFGNRAIYDNGWLACTTPLSLPWVPARSQADLINGYSWELYHLPDDFTEADDLAAKYPDKLHELQILFYAEAARYNVLPLDARGIRMGSGFRPSLTKDRTSFTYYQGMKRIPEGTAADLKNKSFSITADVVVPPGGGQGVIATQGGRFGGWGLFFRNGKIVYHYNLARAYRAEVISANQIPAGKHRIALDFKYDGGGIGKGGVATLVVDDKKAGEARIEHTLCCRISLDETLDIGEDTGTPVSDEYVVPNRFTGAIEKVSIELTQADATTSKAALESREKTIFQKAMQD